MQSNYYVLYELFFKMTAVPRHEFLCCNGSVVFTVLFTAYVLKNKNQNSFYKTIVRKNATISTEGFESSLGCLLRG